MRVNFGNVKLKKKINFGNVKLGIKKIKPQYEELTITPTTETQEYKGSFNKVTVEGDSDLIPENIKEGTSIFGVEGSAKTTNVKITNGSYLFYNGARTDYINEILALCENITSAQQMFYYCKDLTELDLTNLDTSNCVNMNGMFQNSLNLTQLNVNGWNTSKVTDMGGMFGGIKVTELDLSSFDMGKVNKIGYAFSCDYLVNLKSFKNLGKGYTQKTANYSNYTLRLNNANKLSYESLIDVLTNGLYDLNLTYDVANGGTLYRQSCVLGSTNLVKLQATEEGLAALAEADRKGWDVS